jgi:hypothetical protein
VLFATVTFTGVEDHRSATALAVGTRVGVAWSVMGQPALCWAAWELELGRGWVKEKERELAEGKEKKFCFPFSEMVN